MNVSWSATAAHARPVSLEAAAAEHAHPADAAVRPQDRWHFEAWIHSVSFPDLQGGAADGHAVGRLAVIRPYLSDVCYNSSIDQEVYDR